MTVISAIDSIMVLCSLSSLVFLTIYWLSGKASKNLVILFGLFTVNLLYGFLLWLQWTNIATNLERTEDFFGALLPMFWALFFYSYILSHKIVQEQKLLDERKMLEEQLQRNQRMQSVGRLAGGLAHDMNNLLTPILGYSQMLLDDLENDKEAARSLHDILYAASRARELIQQLLAFCRKQELDARPINVCETIDTFKGLLQRTIPESVTIEVSQPQCPAFIIADSGQLEQVIMNLTVNAASACENEGTISIATSLVSSVEGVGGNYVLIEIGDNGCGMDEETVDHIFEPFFSTKGKEGTGLGLSTVYGIVKQHGGHITVKSCLGEGTTFSIFFPQYDMPATEPTELSETLEKQYGSEVVLLVDDEEIVLRMTRAILEKLHYRVYEASNAEEALKIMADSEERIDLLISDVVLPTMNGCQLYEAALKYNPALKVIYMSGYTADLLEFDKLSKSKIEYVQKPFSLTSLATRIREVLH